LVLLPALLAASLTLTAPGALGGPAPTSPVAGGARILPGSADLGPMGPGPIEIVVALRPRNPLGLTSLIADLYRPGSAVYHEFLGPKEFASRFAPAPSTVASLTGYARGRGLDVVSVSANRTLVRLRGNPAPIGAAFGVRLHRYRAGGLTYFAADRAPSLPSAIAPLVSSVVGLSDLGRGHLSVRAPVPAHRARTAAPPHGSSVPVQQSYGPTDLWAVYDAPPRNRGGGQTIAVLAVGDVGPALADLPVFEAKFSLPRVPVTVVPAGPPSTDTSGSVEWDLDTQYSTGFAPDASRLLVYDGASLFNTDMLPLINQWVVEDRARQASFSVGECETDASLSGFQPAVDAVLQQAVAQGQTLFTATGDMGSYCPPLGNGVNGVPAGEPGVDYPASSPWAVAVGGTTLMVNPGPSYGSEVAWYAGGGGLSTVAARPDYQAGVMTAVQRGLPDVSIDGDPETGYQVVVAGQMHVIGGTSAGAPAWLGIWARKQGAQGGNLGFANYTFYREASTFHDVLVGFQGIYPAGPGWDFTTGLGTPDIARLISGS
jgi:pseudomonalisin